MRKNLFTLLTACAVMITVALSGCGGGAKSDGISSSNSGLSGVAAIGAPIQGATITLRDASVPTQVRTTTTSANGSYHFNTQGLTPPFVLTTPWADAKGVNQLHAFAEADGTTNSNPFSHTVYGASGGSDTIAQNPDPTTLNSIGGRHSSVKSALMHKLAQLFSLYGTSQDPETGDYEADNTGLDALFDDVIITISNGVITVTNKATGGVIFTASVNNIDGGTFNPANMPGQPGQVDGAALYTSNCSSCHGPLATSTKLGRTASQIQAAITSNTGGMGQFSTLTALQIQAIATALGTTTGTPPPPPAACTYTYDAWGACQSNNTQVRGVVSATPAGCTGTPVVSQACTYVPPVTTCSSFTYSGWGTCQSNSTQTRTVATSSPAGCTGGTPVLSQSCTYVPPVTTCSSFTYSAWGTCQSNSTQTRTVSTSSPTGCTGGTPVLSQACTYVPPVTTCSSFTYSAWGTCQSNSTQTRTVSTSSPTGCTGGTPVLSQACTYVPPVTTCSSFTYSGWGTCQSNSTQTRTVATSSPTGCTGGTPVLSQSCTYVPPVTTCSSFTYSAWGTCQSNSTQTRTVSTSSPTGCTGGTPVLSQSCTYTPPSTVTKANVTASCTGCHGLTVNTTVFKSGGYTVTGRTAATWLSTVNSMVGLGASLATGTTAQDYANFLATLP